MSGRQLITPESVDRAVVIAIRFVLVPLNICASVIYAIKGHAGLAILCLFIMLGLTRMQAVIHRAAKSRRR